MENNCSRSISSNKPLSFRIQTKKRKENHTKPHTSDKLTEAILDNVPCTKSRNKFQLGFGDALQLNRIEKVNLDEYELYSHHGDVPTYSSRSHSRSYMEKKTESNYLSTNPKIGSISDSLEKSHESKRVLNFDILSSDSESSISSKKSCAIEEDEEHIDMNKCEEDEEHIDMNKCAQEKRCRESQNATSLYLKYEMFNQLKPSADLLKHKSHCLTYSQRPDNISGDELFDDTFVVSSDKVLQTNYDISVDPTINTTRPINNKIVTEKLFCHLPTNMIYSSEHIETENSQVKSIVGQYINKEGGTTGTMQNSFQTQRETTKGTDGWIGQTRKQSVISSTNLGNNDIDDMKTGMSSLLSLNINGNSNKSHGVDQSYKDNLGSSMDVESKNSKGILSAPSTNIFSTIKSRCLSYTLGRKNVCQDNIVEDAKCPQCSYGIPSDKTKPDKKKIPKSQSPRRKQDRSLKKELNEKRRHTQSPQKTKQRPTVSLHPPSSTFFRGVAATGRQSKHFSPPDFRQSTPVFGTRPTVENRQGLQTLHQQHVKVTNAKEMRKSRKDNHMAQTNASPNVINRGPPNISELTSNPLLDNGSDSVQVQLRQDVFVCIDPKQYNSAGDYISERVAQSHMLDPRIRELEEYAKFSPQPEEILISKESPPRFKTCSHIPYYQIRAQSLSPNRQLRPKSPSKISKQSQRKSNSPNKSSSHSKLQLSHASVTAHKPSSTFFRGIAATERPLKQAINTIVSNGKSSLSRPKTPSFQITQPSFSDQNPGKQRLHSKSVPPPKSPWSIGNQLRPKTPMHQATINSSTKNQSPKLPSRNQGSNLTSTKIAHLSTTLLFENPVLRPTFPKNCMYGTSPSRASNESPSVNMFDSTLSKNPRSGKPRSSTSNSTVRPTVTSHKPSLTFFRGIVATERSFQNKQALSSKVKKNKSSSGSAAPSNPTSLPPFTVPTRSKTPSYPRNPPPFRNRSPVQKLSRSKSESPQDIHRNNIIKVLPKNKFSQSPSSLRSSPTPKIQGSSKNEFFSNPNTVPFPPSNTPVQHAVPRFWNPITKPSIPTKSPSKDDISVPRFWNPITKPSFPSELADKQRFNKDSKTISKLSKQSQRRSSSQTTLASHFKTKTFGTSSSVFKTKTPGTSSPVFKTKTPGTSLSIFKTKTPGTSSPVSSKSSSETTSASHSELQFLFSSLNPQDMQSRSLSPSRKTSSPVSKTKTHGTSSPVSKTKTPGTSKHMTKKRTDGNISSQRSSKRQSLPNKDKTIVISRYSYSKIGSNKGNTGRSVPKQFKRWTPPESFSDDFDSEHSSNDDDENNEGDDGDVSISPEVEKLPDPHGQDIEVNSESVDTYAKPTAALDDKVSALTPQNDEASDSPAVESNIKSDTILQYKKISRWLGKKLHIISAKSTATKTRNVPSNTYKVLPLVKESSVDTTHRYRQGDSASDSPTAGNNFQRETQSHISSRKSIEAKSEESTPSTPITYNAYLQSRKEDPLDATPRKGQRESELQISPRMSVANTKEYPHPIVNQAPTLAKEEHVDQSDSASYSPTFENNFQSETKSHISSRNPIEAKSEESIHSTPITYNAYLQSTKEDPIDARPRKTQHDRVSYSPNFENHFHRETGSNTSQTKSVTTKAGYRPRICNKPPQCVKEVPLDSIQRNRKRNKVTYSPTVDNFYESGKKLKLSRRHSVPAKAEDPTHITKKVLLLAKDDSVDVTQDNRLHNTFTPVDTKPCTPPSETEHTSSKNYHSSLYSCSNEPPITDESGIPPLKTTSPSPSPSPSPTYRKHLNLNFLEKHTQSYINDSEISQRSEQIKTRPRNDIKPQELNSTTVRTQSAQRSQTASNKTNSIQASVAKTKAAVFSATVRHKRSAQFVKHDIGKCEKQTVSFAGGKTFETQEAKTVPVKTLVSKSESGSNGSGFRIETTQEDSCVVNAVSSLDTMPSSLSSFAWADSEQVVDVENHTEEEEKSHDDYEDLDIELVGIDDRADIDEHVFVSAETSAECFSSSDCVVEKVDLFGKQMDAGSTDIEALSSFVTSESVMSDV